jgi:hypothetical protein
VQTELQNGAIAMVRGLVAGRFEKSRAAYRAAVEKAVALYAGWPVALRNSQRRSCRGERRRVTARRCRFLKNPSLDAGIPFSGLQRGS